MTMNHSIRPVTAADYPRLTTIWEASVRATHAFLGEADIAFFKPRIARDYLPAVQAVCVCDTDNHILGFAGAADGRLEMLFLDPGCRSQGLGRRLLEYAIARLDVRALDVNEQNPQAVGFYLHMGFEVTGRSERDGMGKPFPLLHMTWAGR